MATSPQTVSFLLDQLAGLGGATAKKMFGEYCLYLTEKPVGLICDDQLFVKPTNAGKAMLKNLVEAPPYPGAKNHYLVAADLWESSEWIQSLIQVTANELPVKNRKSQSHEICIHHHLRSRRFSFVGIL